MPTGTILGVSNKTVYEVSAEKRTKLKRACRDFEALFIGDMLKQMRKSVPKAGLLDSSPAMDIYRSMMDQKIAEKVANERGLGIGEMLFKQLAGYEADIVE